MYISPYNAVPLADMLPQRFSDLADLGRLELCDDDNGDPTLRAVQSTFNERILGALSYIPIINRWEPVVAFTKDIETKNAQVLGSFLQSLSNFGYVTPDGNVVKRLQDSATRIVASVGATSLQSRVFEQLMAIAESGSRLCGFDNLGNTCYANTGLKFLIHSIGKDRLIAHLQEVQNTNSDERKKDTAEKFITLINTAYNSDESLNKELKALFDSLQKHENFSQGDFPIIGHANDTQEFLAKLGECIDLDKLTANTLMTQTTLINGDQKRAPKISSPNYAQDINLSSKNDADLDLQGIVGKILESDGKLEVKWNEGDSENTTVTVQKRWITPNVHRLERFNLHINAMNFDSETGNPRRIFLNTDFTASVQITVIDKDSGAEWQLTLEPKDIIVHDSSASHYHMYTRDKQNSWIWHNDDDVTPDSQFRQGEQAKMISFEVTDRRFIRTGPEAAKNDVHMPA